MPSLTHKEITDRILAEFEQKFTTNKNAHIGAPENGPGSHIIKSKYIFRELESFLSSALHEAATAAADAMVVTKDTSIADAIANTEGSFRPSPEDMGNEIGWNSARADQLSRRTQYFEETKI